MAANYEKVYQRQTEELVGGTRIRDVMEVAFTTLPSEIYCETRIDLSFWTADEVAAMVTNLADYIEVTAAAPYVAGMSFIQDINAAGLLIDTMEIYVTSDSGNSSAVHRQPVDKLYPPIVEPILLALNEKLTAIENQ